MPDVRTGCNLLYDGFCKVWSMLARGKPWTVVQSNDSLNLLIFVRGRDRFLLLRQPRPGKIFLEGGDGKTVSTVAGRFDKNKTPGELAIAEAWEEAGVRVRPEQVDLLNMGRWFYLSPGMNTERAILAYAEVTSDQVEDGEHLRSAESEDEQCERVWMTREQFYSYHCEDIRLFAFREWWFRNETVRGLGREWR